MVLHKGKKIAVLIPARKGSKRLKDKNIFLLNGVPLIIYSINAFYEFQTWYPKSKLYLSSDDGRIQNILEEYGLKDVQFIKRPKKLATDTTKTEQVIQHSFTKMKPEPDIVILLQPTSPMRTGMDIVDALQKFIGCNTLISGYTVDNPIWIEGKMLEKRKRGQKRRKYFVENGAIYIMKKGLAKSGKIFSKRVNQFTMNKYKSIDIDDYDDLRATQCLMKTKWN